MVVYFISVDRGQARRQFQRAPCACVATQLDATGCGQFAEAPQHDAVAHQIKEFSGHQFRGNARGGLPVARDVLENQRVQVGEVAARESVVAPAARLAVCVFGFLPFEREPADAQNRNRRGVVQTPLQDSRREHADGRRAIFAAVRPGARVGEVANRQAYFIQPLRAVAQVVAHAAQHQLIGRAFPVPDHQIRVAPRDVLQRCRLLAEFAKKIAPRVRADTVPELCSHVGSVVDAAQRTNRQIVAQCVHAIVAARLG
ncbi:hypothetical protein ADM96_37625 [Burkholderia sp. ST111]|nr:hypothetical protein ADM96_37625 [Burkholderia sp. ST111]